MQRGGFCTVGLLPDDFLPKARVEDDVVSGNQIEGEVPAPGVVRVGWGLQRAASLEGEALIGRHLIPVHRSCPLVAVIGGRSIVLGEWRCADAVIQIAPANECQLLKLM